MSTMEEIKNNSNNASQMLKVIQSGNKVCLMKKAMYGLKQAGRQWHLKLEKNLKLLGLEPLNADQCIYVARQENDVLITAIYVDDILLLSNNLEWLTNFKTNLGKLLVIKDLGAVNHCLGIEFHQGSDHLEMSQSGYVQELLKKYGMENCNPVTIPLDPGTKLRKLENSSKEEKKYSFRELIGSLMYLAVATRPYLMYAVNHLS